PVEVWATDEHRLGLKPIHRRVWAPIGERPIALSHHRYEWLYVTALSASQPRCGASFSSPSSAAMKSATFRLDHTPPSGGGSRSRILSFSRRSRLRTEGCAPLWRRRSPSAVSPNALYRASSSSIQRGTKLVIADTAETVW